MNKSSIRKLAGLLVLAVLLAAAPLAPAEEAPNVTELMNSYTELDLSPYLGKTVFINFFTEWCYYCMQEMPDIKALYDTYSEDELAIVLVHVWTRKRRQHRLRQGKIRHGGHDFLRGRGYDGGQNGRPAGLSGEPLPQP